MNNGLEIAIIGMAGRFPGAKNVTEFWHNLKLGVESIYFYSREELLAKGIERDAIDNPNFVNAGGKLEEIDLFAADFFGFNPREAELLDPQHRLFLETAWTALEDAGYDGQQYPGAVGVFGGAGMNGYMFNLYRNTQVRDSTSKYQLFLASEKDFLTTRVSYKLSLEGPSVNLQTACSTSLVAVHLACQSLLSGECDMALAGGVALSLSAGYLHQQGGIYSPDGHCRAFDSNAQGTIAGSGVGIVALKRLEDGIRDRDNILAVIKGSAMNNDGEAKVSYTAPRIDTQAKVIRSAQLVAEVEPDTISYVETHGTGTSLGDPIEIAALTQAFGNNINKKQFCAIASVKPNIGHLDAAAGIASLIKTVLALKHQQIPPSINCDRPNVQIDWENSPFYVNSKLTDWSSNGSPRRAGVSSFGIGGTNVHVVLEEASRRGERPFGFDTFLKSRKDLSASDPPNESVSLFARTGEDDPPQPPLRKGGELRQQGLRPQLLVISAKSKQALDEITNNLARHLKENPELDLANVAYTLQLGRRAFDRRRMVVAGTIEEAAKSLSTNAPENVFTNKIEPGSKPVVFMFSGQGSQYQNMGWELYQHEAVFKENCDRCFQILEQYGVSLKEIIFPSNSRKGEQPFTPTSSAQINETQYAQPAIFVIEYALAQLWIDWGVVPEVLIGHSIGEYVAATIAGVFDLKDALKIVATRANLMQQQPAGVMLSVALSASEVAQYLKGGVSLAVSNAPSLCAVSGQESAIAELETLLQDKGIACRRLKTSHGFHSSLMDGAIAPLVEAVKKVKLNAIQIPFISNVTGTWITELEATNPEYWGQHLRQTVRFTEGIAEIVKEPKRILLEVGAGKTLSTLAKQVSSQHTILCSLTHPKENPPSILHSIGQLWRSGVKIDWNKLYTEQPSRVSLPTYPFEKQRYWIESNSTDIFLSTKQESDSNNWFYIPSWSKALPLPKINRAELARQDRWLIFQDELGLGYSLRQNLIDAGSQVITITQGEEFQVIDETSLAIAPNKSDCYQQLVEYLRERDIIPEQIIYLWEISRGERLSPEKNLNFDNLLNLVRTLGKQQPDNLIQLNVIVNNLSDIVGTEDIDLERVSITGITKVINQEYPQINCRLIDTDILPTQSNINYLLSEILTSNDISVAYRNNRRWQPIYQPRTLDSDRSALKQQGKYLIFGSVTEGLGLVFARYLSDRFQAQLVLIGEIDRQKLNIDCLTIEVDINNKQAVSKAIAEAELSLGNIDGVFYSTPMTNQKSASIIADLNSSHWEYNYQTKINPLQILAECLNEKELDFVLVQSSLSSILGGLGLAAYAGANCYLDAFVEQQNNSSDSQTPWFSVNWDACQTAQKQNNTGIGASLIEFSLTRKEVGEATEKILSLTIGSQVIVSKGDLQQRIDRWLKSTPQDNEPAKVNNIQQHSRPNISNEYVAPTNETEKAIAQIWQQVLGIDRVGINDSFFELGGHSLLAIQTISRIREKFQVELPMSSILADTPTVRNLAAIVIDKLPKQEDLAVIDALLQEVQNMTPEEVKAEMED